MTSSAALFTAPRPQYKSADIALGMLNHVRSLVSQFCDAEFAQDRPQYNFAQVILGLHPYNWCKPLGNLDYLTDLAIFAGIRLKACDVNPTLNTLCQALIFSITPNARRFALEGVGIEDEVEDGSIGNAELKKGIYADLKRNLTLSHFEELKKRTDTLTQNLAQLS